jgi:hypothetical protein
VTTGKCRTPTLGGILSQQQPHRQRVMAILPPTAHQPYRRQDLAPASVLRCTLLSSLQRITFVSSSSGSSTQPLSMLPLCHPEIESYTSAHIFWQKLS